MKLSQFSSLSLDRRARLVLKDGKLLAVRQDKTCCVFLYHMHGFFVEVWHSAVGRRVKLSSGSKTLGHWSLS